MLAQLGEELESLPLVERLLRCSAEAAHAEMAAALWDAQSDEDAYTALEHLAAAHLPFWEEQVRALLCRAD